VVVDGSDVEVPFDGTINGPNHVPPSLNKISSPAENVLEFIFAIVCQEVEVDVPLLASLPLEEM
jgi:hypothetical protein